MAFAPANCRVLSGSKVGAGERQRNLPSRRAPRFRDGWLLLKMVWFAYRKLKAI
jgi:hypothetical protein